MERFFVEHHVLQDRDSDELNGRVNSDSEASDTDEEITSRVRSVADPTGPWTQKPTDAEEWGRAQRRRGTPNRHFQSQHTGPKGVINDYKAHKRHAKQERERKERERHEVLLRIAKGATAEEPGDDDSDDCDCCDDLVDAAFLQQYQQMRIAQLQAAAQRRCVELLRPPSRRQQFGSLEHIEPEKFLELTTDVEPAQLLLVHLSHPANYACGLVNQHFATLAAAHPHVHFVSMVATDADETFGIQDLPAILVYQGSTLQDTIVHLSRALDGEFTLERLSQLLTERLEL
ncbi:TPA: hypothetical protein N0F65_001499 [Lagenidium giganteum]|uniref:Phosducin domain-containing protein n=1 Tax=Lagenidium giganteum TaxID=4803 RepID=A0AAV2Z422_9STRA|nr:TPA: hypothetical protein N0F65_001499 [Lagenidium giganteum]